MYLWESLNTPLKYIFFVTYAKKYNISNQDWLYVRYRDINQNMNLCLSQTADYLFGVEYRPYKPYLSCRIIQYVIHRLLYWSFRATTEALKIYSRAGLILALRTLKSKEGNSSSSKLCVHIISALWQLLLLSVFLEHISLLQTLGCIPSFTLQWTSHVCTSCDLFNNDLSMNISSMNNMVMWFESLNASLNWKLLTEIHLICLPNLGQIRQNLWVTFEETFEIGEF